MPHKKDVPLLWDPVSYHLSWLLLACFSRGCVTIVSLQAVAGIRAIGRQVTPSVMAGLSGCPASFVWS